jgi:hypothetical protein
MCLPLLRSTSRCSQETKEQASLRALRHAQWRSLPYRSRNRAAQIAKEVLSRRLHLVLRKLRLENAHDTWLGYSGGRVEFDSARLEQRVNELIPDVIVRKRDRELIIEFAVTHKCDAEKISKVKTLYIAALEIDVSNFRAKTQRP